MTNPDNFVEHRRALMRFSAQMPTPAAAWKLTGDANYARFARLHLRAWFIIPETRMNPNLLDAQAIQGRFTGRGIGIIDTIHLVGGARDRGDPPSADPRGRGMEHHRRLVRRVSALDDDAQNGQDERDAKNNHGTCWVMQVAAFAHLTKNEALLPRCAASATRPCCCPVSSAWTAASRWK